MFIEDIIAVGTMPGMQNALFTIVFLNMCVKYVDHSYIFVEPFCFYLMAMKKQMVMQAANFSVNLQSFLVHTYTFADSREASAEQYCCLTS